MEALPVGVEDSHSSLRASMIVKFEARIEVMSRHMIIRAGEHVGRRHVENCGAMGEAQWLILWCNQTGSIECVNDAGRLSWEEEEME